MTLTIFSWIAVVAISASFWFQVWKIHVHREVRDLSIVFYCLITVGLVILAFAAYHEKSLLFMVKQIASLIPAVIIIFQIIYHKGDRWHDSPPALCGKCNDEIDPGWGFCPACGQATESF